jgi:hypothetical protein
MVGDFNLMRSPENRNRPGGDTNNMMLFNDIISHLNLVEVPLKNRSFTWSNMQQNALLEKLDWVFTSSNWTTSFPNSLAFALSHAVSDHVPIVIQMESMVLKPNVFRFENFWICRPDFLPTVDFFWNLPSHRAMLLSGKLKLFRRGLKAWSQEISKLNKRVNNSSYVLALLDGLEEQRALSIIEINFRQLLKSHLLEAKRVYWKQRATIGWVKFRDENTKLFHSIALLKLRRNHIASLQALDGSHATDHEHKATIL